ncbi:MAG TPA: ATP-binding protein [Pseudonocardiaceae bacterium]|nr:ATP-binding protein [Pseudonocardiaceae bacterium]
MPTTDYPIFVRVERGVRWILERYRSPATRALVNKARFAAARLLAPPDTASRSVVGGESPSSQGSGAHEVLARMSATVARRDLNLVDSLLARLEDMEASESDPDALARLYQLDHLAARLRRNAENLRVLAGHDAGSRPGAPSPLIDVIRAAMSSIEHYRRIEIERAAGLAVVDLVADDLSRLLAELLDNATRYSPPMSKVTVSAHLTGQGTLPIRIDDAGHHLPADRLQALNAQLSDTESSGDSVEQMGLSVVRRLAGKHGIRVSLDNGATRGTSATVLLPPSLVGQAPATPWFADTPMMNSPRPAPAAVEASPPPAVTTPDPEHSSAEAAGPAKPLPTPRTTRNGLPRRIPQSLREFGAFPASVPSPRNDPDTDRTEDDPSEGREQLMADIGDFSDGEQAARQQRPAGKPRETT